jgi:hypothetical protein
MEDGQIVMAGSGKGGQGGHRQGRHLGVVNKQAWVLPFESPYRK